MGDGGAGSGMSSGGRSSTSSFGRGRGSGRSGRGQPVDEDVQAAEQEERFTGPLAPLAAQEQLLHWVSGDGAAGLMAGRFKVTVAMEECTGGWKVRWSGFECAGVCAR